MSPEPTQRPYVWETSDEGVAEVASWGWEQVGESRWQTEGKCPRCKHLISTVVDRGSVGARFEIAMSLGVDKNTAVSESLKTAIVRCRCGVAHPSKEAGEGCGFYAVIPSPSDTETAFRQQLMNVNV